MRQFLETYLRLVTELPGGDGFWSWCPEDLKASKREVEISTSIVRRFLSMTADDVEALMEDGQRVVVEKRNGAHDSIQGIHKKESQGSGKQ